MKWVKFKMDIDNLEATKFRIQLARQGVFSLTSIVTAIGIQIRKYVSDTVNALPLEYARQREIGGIENLNPTRWLTTIKKSQTQGKKILKKLAKYDEILLIKRSEFMDIYSKATSHLMECMILYKNLDKEPPPDVTVLLQYQQESKRFISKIIKLNTLIAKLNFKLDQFAAFGAQLQGLTYLFPGVSVPAFEIHVELAKLNADDLHFADDSFMEQLTKDLVSNLPEFPDVPLEPVRLDGFGANYKSNFLTGMSDSVLDKDELYRLAVGAQIPRPTFRRPRGSGGPPGEPPGGPSGGPSGGGNPPPPPGGVGGGLSGWDDDLMRFDENIKSEVLQTPSAPTEELMSENEDTIIPGTYQECSADTPATRFRFSMPFSGKKGKKKTRKEREAKEDEEDAIELGTGYKNYNIQQPGLTQTLNTDGTPYVRPSTSTARQPQDQSSTSTAARQPQDQS